MTVPLSSEKKMKLLTPLSLTVRSFPAQSFSQSLHLSFYKHSFNLANSEVQLCMRQSSSGDHERGQNLHVQSGWAGAWGFTGCADSFRMLGKQWQAASEVCLSLSMGVKRNLVIKAKLSSAPRWERKAE